MKLVPLDHEDEANNSDNKDTIVEPPAQEEPRKYGKGSGKKISIKPPRIRVKPKNTTKPKPYRLMLVKLITRLFGGDPMLHVNSREYGKQVKSVFDAMDNRIKKWNNSMIQLFRQAGVTQADVVNASLKKHLDSDRTHVLTQARESEYPSMIMRYNTRLDAVDPEQQAAKMKPLQSFSTEWIKPAVADILPINLADALENLKSRAQLPQPSLLPLTFGTHSRKDGPISNLMDTANTSTQAHYSGDGSVDGVPMSQRKNLFAYDKNTPERLTRSKIYKKKRPAEQSSRAKLAEISFLNRVKKAKMASTPSMFDSSKAASRGSASHSQLLNID